MSLIAIIDYGSGNLRSVEKAVELAAADGQTVCVTAQADDVARADHIILPGVGAFADCKAGLDSLPGMVDAMTKRVHDDGRAFLGICVGMQLLAKQGFEHGTTDGLGWIDGQVVPVEPNDPALNVPHMGWNEINVLDQAHPVLGALPSGAHCYFANSYFMHVNSADQKLATTDYGGEITAAVGTGNILGTQFHPEKSQKVGAALLKAFLEWRP